MRIFKTIVKKLNRAISIMGAVAAATALLTGCSSEALERKVVFTTGFSDDEVFRIEDSTCSLTEAMVYLVNTRTGYESTFGSEIWSAVTDSGTVEDRLKESVLAKIAQIKVMNLLAKETGIELEDGDEELAKTAAAEYYGTLTEADIEAMNNVTVEEIADIYKEQAVADRLYDYIIRDINPEISDDEARTITVEQIFFKTYSLDASGEKIPFSDDRKRAVLSLARDVMLKLNQGGSFDELMAQYNEADEGTISFRKGEKDSAYEAVAFNLGNEEVSSITEVEDGYVIIKCISTFNREETEANKVKIVEMRKKEVFGEQYDAFVATLTKELNHKLWDSISLSGDSGVSTSSLMEVYQKYFN
ncbi:peptidylprolyl isomerase [Butyrivibrio sp. FCS014]|uniref:peptidylprolyl isomerase n=1 Tax=Butyrivibrio sp. FCS014 TaxID=1408304 RepID=UPI0004633E87|nr:peptidylprolyl isomerase [Butyrivibrio sp. FCS014]